MTPEANTLYSVLLFATLATLNHWLNRRHRIQHQVRQQVAAGQPRQAPMQLVPVLPKG
jgi:hypothetical protein